MQLSVKFLQLICLGILVFNASKLYSCTTVFANNKGSNKVVARTVDLYMSDSPMLVTHARGEQHNGDAGENSLTWKSKFGNLVVTA